MPSRPTKRAGPHYARAVANIARLEHEHGLQQREVAAGIGMSPPVYCAKRSGVRSHFYEDEFATIRDFFSRKTGRPLTGFPHLEWEVMLACDRKIFGWPG